MTVPKNWAFWDSSTVRALTGNPVNSRDCLPLGARAIGVRFLRDNGVKLRAMRRDVNRAWN